MRTTNICPKCDSRTIWAVQQVNHPDPRSREKLRKMVVTAGVVPPEKPGFWAIEECVEAGRFELRVCAKCGYTEWYAKNANEMLAVLAQVAGLGVRLIDAENLQQGPFR